MKALVALLCLWAPTAVVTGSSAGVPVFGLKGGSVRLSVAETQQSQIRQFAWMCNSSLIVEYTPRLRHVDYFPNYNETVEFNPTDLSLLIYNLSHTHTGTYSTRVTRTTGSTTDRDQYNLTVLNGVPTPVLSLTVLGGSCCNLSVTCSAGWSNASYNCDCVSNCSEPQTEVQPGVSFTLERFNDGFHCNVTNPVSSQYVQLQHMPTTCPEIEKLEEQKPILVAVLVTVAVVIFVAVCARVRYKRWKKKKTKCFSQGNNNPERSDPPDMPQTVYCTLAHAQQNAPPQQHIPLLNNDSIYSEVRK